MTDYVELEVPDNDDATYNIKIRKESAARIRSLSAQDRKQFMQRLVGRLRDSGIPKTQKTDDTKKKPAKRKAANPEKNGAKPAKKEPKKKEAEPKKKEAEPQKKEAETKTEECSVAPEPEPMQPESQEPASQESE